MSYKFYVECYSWCNPLHLPGLGRANHVYIQPCDWRSSETKSHIVLNLSCMLQDGPVELLPFLFLGSAVHSSRREMLTAAGITAVLNVSSTCPNLYEGEFKYLRLTVEDTLAADIRACFNTAIAFIGESLASLTVQRASNYSEQIGVIGNETPRQFMLLNPFLIPDWWTNGNDLVTK